MAQDEGGGGPAAGAFWFWVSGATGLTVDAQVPKPPPPELAASHVELYFANVSLRSS